MKAFLISGAALAAMAIPALAGAAQSAPQGNSAQAAAHASHPTRHARQPVQDLKRADIEAQVKEHFTKLDTNRDGAITQAEITAHHQARKAARQDARFKALDSNGDGSISRAEFDAAHSRPEQGRPGADRPDRPTTRPAAPLDARPVGAEGHTKEAGGKRFGGPGKHRHGHGFGVGGGAFLGGKAFERADANKDGKVTLAEATATALAHFDKVDANKDGVISAQERQDFHKSAREEWKNRADKAQ